ncbi:MAG: hypothetical protein C4541_08940 [Candidatus Auribacter fodinae]|jgi:hypothetical protein|uniref:Uncharacterized protein n=1 Tax=Candidatus Auribacter fodinae TaxID=2093366 RepID=A0A3A4QVL4_9BACT|nr:MAG: hypothetical protein C4541_08940 [Candidatus Auribacter fodinae]
MEIRSVISVLISYILIFQPYYLYAVEKTQSPQTGAFSVTYNLPGSYGEVVECYNYDKQNSREVVVIVDAHSNLSAQFNISHLMRHLTLTKNVNTIYLEGASGEIQKDWFSFGDDLFINESISRFLLENGFFTGAEYFCATSEQDVSCKGAEFIEDYNENLTQLKELRRLDISGQLRELITCYTKWMISSGWEIDEGLDEEYRNIVLDGSDILSFVNSLTQKYYARITDNNVEFPELAHFAFLARHGQKMDNLVKSLLMELKKTRVNDEEFIAEINTVLKQIYLESDADEFLENAYSLLHRVADGLNPSAWQAVEEYYRHYTAMRSVSSDVLYHAILDGYKKLSSEGTAYAEQFSFRNQLLGLYKGYSLNLSPGEFNFFDVESFSVEQIVDFLEWQAASLTPERCLRMSGAVARLNDLQQRVVAFFQSAEGRNTSMFQRLYADVQPGETAILVVGGYHRDIAALLAEQGFRVSVVMPHLELSSDFKRDISYNDHMEGKFSSLEKFLYYSWSTIVAPLVAQSVAALPDRQTAIKPMVARQLALMLGTALSVEKGEAQGISKTDIIERLDTIYSAANPVSHQMINDFLGLPGNSAIPAMPALLDYVPVAGGQGIVMVFSIGDQRVGVQLIPDGAELSDVERSVLHNLPGYTITNSVMVADRGYQLTMFDIPRSTSFFTDLAKHSIVPAAKNALFIFLLMIVLGADVQLPQFLSRVGLPQSISTVAPAYAGDSTGVVDQELKAIIQEYRSVSPELKSWIEGQSAILSGSKNEQLDISFSGLWQSYQNTNNPNSTYIAKSGRVWPYDASLGLYTALVDKDYAPARRAVDTFMSIIRAEKRKGYKGLFHFSYNTRGDMFIDPREPMGNTLWPLKAMYAYMRESGDLQYYDELTRYVRESVFPLQVLEKDNPAYGFIRAGYAHPNGLAQGGYNIYSNVSRLNTINNSAVTEHNADFIDLLRLMTEVIDAHRPGREQTLRSELKTRHALIMQASNTARKGKHWPTQIGADGSINWSRAVDHYTWLASTFIGLDEEIAWESVQILSNEFTTVINSIEFMAGNKVSRVDLPKPAKGLIFFSSDYKDQYVDFTIAQRAILEKMIQPESTSGGIVFLHNYIQSTKNPQRREYALRLMRELLDGLATVHKTYKNVYGGGSMPYATENIQFFNSTPSMAGTASYYIALRVMESGYSRFIGTPLPKGFETALKDTIDLSSLPGAPSQAPAPKPERQIEKSAPVPKETGDKSPVSIRPIPIWGSDDITENIRFRTAKVENGRIRLNLEMPSLERKKYRIVLLEKSDLYYVQPYRGSDGSLQRDYPIGSGEFVLSTLRNQLAPGKTMVLVIDPSQINWKPDAMVTREMIIEAIQKGAVKERIIAQSRISRAEIASIADHRRELLNAGILPEDFEALMELTDDERIVGDLDKLRVLSKVNGYRYHQILLRAYARELGHLIVHSNGLEAITRKFEDTVGRKTFEEMRTEIEYFWDIDFRDDYHFIDELIDFYMDSKFTGFNTGFFQTSLFADLDNQLRDSMGTELFNMLRFSSISGEWGSDSLIESQVDHVQNLAAVARILGKDIRIFSRGTGTVVDAAPAMSLKTFIGRMRLLDTSL